MTWQGLVRCSGQVLAASAQRHVLRVAAPFCFAPMGARSLSLDDGFTHARSSSKPASTRRNQILAHRAADRAGIARPCALDAARLRGAGAPGLPRQCGGAAYCDATVRATRT